MSCEEEEKEASPKKTGKKFSKIQEETKGDRKRGRDDLKNLKDHLQWSSVGNRSLGRAMSEKCHWIFQLKLIGGHNKSSPMGEGTNNTLLWLEE